MEEVCGSKNFSMHCALHDGDLISTGENARPILADISHYKVWFEMCSSWVNLQKKDHRLSYGLTYRMCEDEAKELGMSASNFAHISAVSYKLGSLRTNKNSYDERQALLTPTAAEFLKEKIEPVKLSELTNKGIALCSECSIIAQAYLEKQGIESYICSGVLWQDPKKTPESHHFLMICDNDKMFVFDPLNSKGIRPRVVDTGLNKKTFMEYAESNANFILECAAEARDSTWETRDTHWLAYAKKMRNIENVISCKKREYE